jgi:hypothetical protein
MNENAKGLGFISSSLGVCIAISILEVIYSYWKLNPFYFPHEFIYSYGGEEGGGRWGGGEKKCSHA